MGRGRIRLRGPARAGRWPRRQAQLRERGTGDSGAGVDHRSVADRLTQLGVGMTRVKAREEGLHDADRLEPGEGDHDALVVLLRDPGVAWFLAVGIQRVEHADAAPVRCPGSERAPDLQEPTRGDPDNGHRVAVARGEVLGGGTLVGTGDVHLDHAPRWIRPGRHDPQARRRHEVRPIGVDAIFGRPEFVLGPRPPWRPALDGHSAAGDPGQRGSVRPRIASDPDDEHLPPVTPGPASERREADPADAEPPTGDLADAALERAATARRR